MGPPVLLIGENIEPPCFVGTQCLDPVENGKVLILHFLQDNRQQDDILNRRILQQINLPQHLNSSCLHALNVISNKEAKLETGERFGYLVEHDVGVDDEDGSRGGVEFALGGGVAGCAGDEATVDIVAEVVLPDVLRREGDGVR